MQQMDKILKDDDFHFLNTQNTKSQAHRSKTSGMKENHNRGSTQGRSQNQPSVLSSFRERKLNGVTGVNTYMYEVMAMPMQTSFMHSIEKRKKVLNNSIKQCNRSCEKNRFRSRYSTNARTKRKYKNESQDNSVEHVKVQENSSIFDRFPEKTKVNSSSHLHESHNSSMNANSSMDFKNLPAKVQLDMQGRVLNQIMEKRNSRIRSKPLKNFPIDSRQSIALRIMNKLQNWPEERPTQTFKKFYWTKDYSH